ncbi:PREDICTED: glucan endo-1,3-beta-glucosidase 14-like [Ipomoea nil]|uniref:glucan endo-1,3-beta-glucosidase 14-like n=1 Tax=Ipomoea nil TaxID=35883 RepID=UPI000900AA60|nr:PREDICTED: glucan endo-1,3-beta-glucosidase 14-like [Ipomoea nil]
MNFVLHLVSGQRLRISPGLVYGMPKEKELHPNCSCSCSPGCQSRNPLTLRTSNSSFKYPFCNGLPFWICFTFQHKMCSFPLILSTILLLTVSSSNVFVVHAFVGTYGVNYGRIADNIPSPESVVTLLRANKIKNIRIYDADHSVLTAFKGSGVEIIVGLPNEYLKGISASQDSADDWVKQNVEAFLPGTKIVGIAVGNEILGGGDAQLWEVLVPAVKNVYNALETLHLSKKIEVSSPHSEAVFESTYPPSAGAFKQSLLPYLRPLLQFFHRTGSPFYINAYPFLAYKNDPSHINLQYALFESNAGINDDTTKLHYDNMFDAMLDASYVALEKLGFPKMEVIVSETGWASKGDGNEAGANVKNALTYNNNLRKRLMKKKGTPYRPKAVVRAYIFALFNENLKPGPTSERHFGLFKHNGGLAYKNGFKGLGSTSAAAESFLSYKVSLICAAMVILLLGS